MSYDIKSPPYIIGYFMDGWSFVPTSSVCIPCMAQVGSVQAETFKVMERRLLTAIMTPAMIASFIWYLVNFS